MIKDRELSRTTTQQMNTKDSYLDCCRKHLESPSKIDPARLAQFFASNSSFGVNDIVTNIIQHYFFNNQNNSQIVRYIKLIDRLIFFYFSLPNKFAIMFAHTYHKENQRQRTSNLEQLRVMRKTWMPFLKQTVINELRLQVYKLTNIDIQQQGLKQQSKQFIRSYFINNLRIMPDQAQVMISTYPLINNILQVSSQSKQLKEREKDKLMKINESQDKLRKRRKICEQTQDSEEAKQPNTKERALMILNKLKKMNNFSCKQCGRFFQTQNAYQAHNKKHFTKKLLKFKIKTLWKSFKNTKIMPKKHRNEYNCSEWVNYGIKQQREIRNTDTIIKIIDGKRRSCDFCGSQFDIQIVDDNFVYKKVVQVKQYTHQNFKDMQHDKLTRAQDQEYDRIQTDKMATLLMHGQCYLSLQQYQ